MMNNKIHNTLKLLYRVGRNYLAFKSNKSDKDFDTYLLNKIKNSYERYSYIWLYSNYERKQDLNALLNLWYLGKDDIIFTKDSKEEKFHASAFESAISFRNESAANDALEYLDMDSNYLELANIFIYVFFNPDRNIKTIVLADKPRPYYLHYLFPMCEGILAESRNDLPNALLKYKIAIKRIQYVLPDRTFLDARIRDITNQIYSTQREIKNSKSR